MKAETPRPPQDLPTMVVQQVQDIARKLDLLLTMRRLTAPAMPAVVVPKNEG